MAYLNDVRIVSYLAIRPELSFSKAGRRYCNFIVRLLFKNDRNEDVTDYINVTCFDDDAEILVRDGDIGDTLLCTAYLAQQHWWVDGQHLTKIVVIADSVQIVAKGKGEMPPVLAMDSRQAQPAPYNVKAGVDAFVSSFSIPWQKEKGFRPEVYKNPQPQKDGTWTMPSSRVSAAVGRFMTENPDVASGVVDPIQPDKDVDLKRASQILPEDLPVRFNGRGDRIVFLPYGKQVSEARYKELLAIQSEDLGNMEPDRRRRVLEIAEKRFRIKLRMCNLPSSAPNAGAQYSNANEGDAPRESGDNSDSASANSVAENANKAYTLFGMKEEDWYQDENGQWKRKGS